MGTTGAERSNSINNFTIPHELRWGNRRFLRCVKVDSDDQISPLRRVAASNSDQRRRSNCTLPPRTAGGGKRERGGEIDSWSKFLHRSRKVCRASPPASDFSRRFSGYDGGIAAMRERVILDLQTAAEEMKDAIFKERLAKGEVYKGPPLPHPPAAASATVSVESELIRPWNLRTRRADLKTSASRFVSSTNVVAAAAAARGGGESAGEKEPMEIASKPNFEESQIAAVIEKPMRLRSDGGAAASGGKKERPKFAVALSKREIEEDFYSLVGRRPPRRPKKRNRNVQRQLDTLFPGLWLSEVTPNMYKVPDGEGR